MNGANDETSRDEANQTAGRPLEGVRVLDLTHYVAGPYCTRLLAEQGASVLKIERPGGDPIRKWPPFFAGADEPSLFYHYLNHGKETLTLDLAAPGGRDRVLELAREADVAVENFRPGTLDRFQLGWDVLHSVNPRLILTSISNFGQYGPYREYRAWDIVADALGGLAYIHGRHNREPLTHGNPQAQYRAGVVAVSATLAALFNRGDEGEHVDVSIMECVSATLRDTILQYTYMGVVRQRSGRVGGVTRAADGWVIPSINRDGDFAKFARFLQVPELQDERFATPAGRQLHAAELTRRLQDVIAKMTMVDFFEGAQKWGFGTGIVMTPAQALHCEQFLVRNFFEDIEIGPGRFLPAPRGAVSV